MYFYSGLFSVVQLAEFVLANNDFKRVSHKTLEMDLKSDVWD